jgi:hypothetical protein
MNHPLQCRCGTLQGHVDLPSPANRVVCYCRDCQAFAIFLGRAAETLDPQGGSDVIQVLQAKLKFTRGMDSLACMRLSHTGLLRWYARCCNTPIGNTLADPRISFIGLLHDCLGEEPSLSASFGPVSMRSFTGSAMAKVPSSKIGFLLGVRRIAAMVIRARIDGSYRRSPLFDGTTRAPIVEPRILSLEERRKLS